MAGVSLASMSLRQRTYQNWLVSQPSSGQLTTYGTWERRHWQLGSERSTDRGHVSALLAKLCAVSVLISWASEELLPVNDYTRVLVSSDRLALKIEGSDYSFA